MNLISKLKIFRKAFLTKSWRRYYSQFGEDAVLRELLRKKASGFYVDVGCFHPSKFSNTYWLYKRGWRGINIDMEPQKIALFNLVRPHDINRVAAVSNCLTEMVIQKTKEFDLGAKLVPGDTQIGDRITTQALTEIIDSTPFKGRVIDLLTVDVEGMDLEVSNRWISSGITLVCSSLSRSAQRLKRFLTANCMKRSRHMGTRCEAG